MQFIDLASQQQRIKDKIDARIQTVLSHGKYIMGPEIKELENALATYVGVKHAVGCGSGTDALLLALMAYDVGPGDVIFTTPFTFIATAEVVALLGAVPVFVDIDPVTFNMDPAKLKLAVEAVKVKDPGVYPLPGNFDGQLTPRGIIAVDLFGMPADYDAVNTIAEDHGLFVIQDAAQSFGGEYKGQKACSQGHIGCTSFFPAKPLGCYGDGGMCFTNDDGLADKMDSLRIHGKGTDKYDNIRIGINGRLDTFQAAILMEKFGIFPEEVELRQAVANRYRELLSGGSLTPPTVPQDYLSVWAQYSILAADEQERAKIQGRLQEAGIPMAIYYPRPLHLQTAFSYLGYREGVFPISEDSSRRIFSVPMHPYLKEEDQERIAQAVKG